MNNIHRLARFLGWFSVGLGLTELFASHALDQFLGTDHREKTLRFFGLRELAAGVGILSRPVPGPLWVWARVAGDALDLARSGLRSTPTKNTARTSPLPPPPWWASPRWMSIARCS